MLCLLVPPVGPDSEPREIAAWIEQLQRLRSEYHDLSGALAAAEWRLSEAREWLRAGERRAVA